MAETLLYTVDMVEPGRGYEIAMSRVILTVNCVFMVKYFRDSLHREGILTIFVIFNAEG